ncbi:MAG: ankyrin repeat domain-containing protein [Bacteroidales bacterium]|nr:ankyrin repeat domain-containing protein [Bacteroidales bacterium]
MLAIYYSDLKMVKLLVNNGANVNQKNIVKFEGDTVLYCSPLTIAAGVGKIEIVKFLIEKCDIPADDHKLTESSLNCVFSPIHFASIFGHINIIKYLISKGAKVDHYSFLDSPLKLALLNQQWETAEYLAKEGIVTFMDESYFYDIVDVRAKKVFKNLLERGASVSSSDSITDIRNNDWPIIHYACSANDLSMVKLLFSLGSCIANKDGMWGMLFYAQLYNNQKMIDFINNPYYDVFSIIEYDLVNEFSMFISLNNDSINIKNSEGQTFLHHAIYYNSVEIFDFLINNNKFDINQRDKMGRTPLYFAIFVGNLDFAKKLIEKNADPELKCINCESAIELAKRRNYSEIISLVKKNGYQEKKTYPKSKVIPPPSQQQKYKKAFFSKNDDYFTTISNDNFVKLWDSKTGMVIRSFVISSGIINVAMITDNLQYLIIGSDKSDVIIYDIYSGKTVRSLKCDFKGGEEITSVSVSKDMSKILASSDNRVVIWNFLTGDLIKSYEIEDEYFSSVCFSPDEKSIVASSKKGNVWNWDLESNKRSQIFTTNSIGGICYCIFLKDGKHILAMTNDEIFVIDAINYMTLMTLSDLQNLEEIKCTDYEIIAYNNQKIIKWSIPDFNILLTDTIADIIGLSNNGKMAVSSDYHTSYLISGLFMNMNKIKISTGSKETIENIDFSQNGEMLLFDSPYDNRFGIIDLKDPFNYISFDKKHQFVYFTKEKLPKVIIVQSTNQIDVFDFNFNKTVKEFKLNNSSSNNQMFIAINDKRNKILYSSIDSLFSCSLFNDSVLFLGKSMYQVDNTDNSQCVFIENLIFKFGKFISYKDFNYKDSIRVIYGAIENNISNFTVSKDLQNLAYSSSKINSNVIKIRSLNNQYEPFFLMGHNGYISTLCFSSISGNLLSGCTNGQTKLWDIAKKKEIISFPDIESGISTIISADSCDRFISLSWDRVIRLYEYNNPYEIASFYIPENNCGMLIVLHDNYYSGTQSTVTSMHHVIGLKCFPFEQFDLKYNRPDIVLARIGYASDTLIEAYHQAYLRRLNKMGFTEEQLSGEFNIPETKIDNYDDLPYLIDNVNGEVNLQLSFSDSLEVLNRYNIWINDVPLYGMTGKSIINKNTKSFSTTAKVPLSNGENRIQVSCMNNAGAESYKETYYVNYAPPETKKPELHVIAIAVSKYQGLDDLQYAEIDAKSIVAQFSNSTLYSSISIDTLYGENATISNIESLKAELYTSDVDDQVIVFYSGHGLLDKNYNYYLGTTNINPLNPSEKGIPYSLLEWLIDSIPARNKLLLLDACHSGEVDNELANYTLQTDTVEAEIELSMDYNNDVASVEQQHKGNLPPTTSYLGLQQSFELMKDLFADIDKSTGAIVISAAGGLEAAFESNPWGHGAFTYCLLKGLEGMTADANNDGQISIGELKNYINLEVEKLTNGRQKPTTRTENLVNDFVIWE